MNKVAILIPIHNRIEITKQGIADLYAKLDNYKSQSVLPVEFDIVVTDDGSTDGSAEWIRLNYPSVHLVFGNGDLWWSGAINAGTEYAIRILKSTHVLFWNDDIYTDDSYFLLLAKRVHELNGKPVIIGSYIYEYPDTEKLWSKGGYFNKYLGLRRMYKNRKIDKHVSKTYWFTGMGTLVSVDIFLKLNYIDAENFPHYFGDTDFTLRAYEAGYQLLPCSELKIWNKVAFSSFIAKKSWKDYYKSLTLKQSRYNIQKEILFCRRHSVTPFWILFFLKQQSQNLFGFLNAKYLKR